MNLSYTQFKKKIQCIWFFFWSFFTKFLGNIPVTSKFDCLRFYNSYFTHLLGYIANRNTTMQMVIFQQLICTSLGSYIYQENKVSKTFFMNLSYTQFKKKIQCIWFFFWSFFTKFLGNIPVTSKFDCLRFYNSYFTHLLGYIANRNTTMQMVIFQQLICTSLGS